MSLALSIFALSLITLVSLFVYQLVRLRQGNVERLPGLTFSDIIAPVAVVSVRWGALVRRRIRHLTLPILLQFYEALLRFLHTLISRIAERFNHLADTIKGRGVVVGRARTPSLHWREYRKLD